MVFSGLARHPAHLQAGRPARCAGGSWRRGQFREVTLPSHRAPAPASIVSHPLATVAKAADGGGRKRCLLSPGCTWLFAASLLPAFLPGIAGPASSWGKRCLGRKRRDHPTSPARLHLCLAGSATCCLTGHEACGRPWQQGEVWGWVPAPGAGKRGVGLCFDIS